MKGHERIRRPAIVSRPAPFHPSPALSRSDFGVQQARIRDITLGTDRGTTLRAAPWNLGCSKPIDRLQSAHPPFVIRRQTNSRNDPTRFQTVHENLFINAPVPGGAPLRPWQSSLQAQVVQDFKNDLSQWIASHPTKLLGTAPAHTTEAAAETDAIAADGRIRGMFSFIPTRLSESQIRQSVTVFQADQPVNRPFLEQWLENKLPDHSDIELYNIAPTDVDYQSIVTTLAGDTSAFDFGPVLSALRTLVQAQPGWSSQQVQVYMQQTTRQVQGKSWQWVFGRLASRVGAFESAGQVSMSSGLPATRRRASVIHELVHLYAHSDYTRWVDTTRGPRIYNEGFTEYLARLVMSPQELSGRRSYADRLQLINEKVVPYASSDDIARAYFLGEVWRLEGRSTIATELFQRDIGLTEGVPRQTEVTEAAAAKGVVQEVVSGSHYRFMNFDIDSATPRPEHETYLRDVVIAQFVRNAPAARLQFVGHASSTGSPAHNRRLSQSRAAALYQLAARLGVPAAQLVDATSPPHQGEDQPTADNASVFGRALNRRVELFITHVTTP